MWVGLRTERPGHRLQHRRPRTILQGSRASVQRCGAGWPPTQGAVCAGLVAVAFGAMLVPRAWEEWTEVVLGLWPIASPWALGFAGLSGAMRAAAVTGVVIAVLALWTLAIDKDYTGWLHDHRTAH